MELEKRSQIGDPQRGQPMHLPVTSEEFSSVFFEKKPILFQQALHPGGYTWCDLSRDFYSLDPGLGQVRVYQDGPLDRMEYTRSNEELSQVNYVHHSSKLEKLLSDGASIVVNRFDKVSLYVGLINSYLREYVKSTVVGNAYISLGGRGTFGAHWDTHCVFAVQIKGRKRWKVYKPTSDLPLFTQTSRQAKKEGAQPTELAFDEIIQEGDVLYLPRGWWHEVLPLDGEPSFHVAYGVHTVKVHEFLKWLLVKHMPQAVEFRQSLDDVSAREKNLLEAVAILSAASLSEKNITDYVNEFLAQLTPKTHIDFQSIMEA